ncbi:MAG TPA: hypothetical protein VFA55_04465, partial [Candidatus Kapabacteria bacterium]|nr:hypothetical protein [Candidatus Kapabacteria bacterium]
SIDWFSGFGMESSTSGYFPEIFEPSATILNLYYQTKRRPFTFVPTFLMGRDHKIRSYSISEFGDLSNYFRVSVQNADILVLIGFSGKDLNVSRVIENWLMENLTKRNLWIIDPAGEEVKKRLLVWAEKPDVANQVKIVPNMDAANWNDIKSNSV